MAGWERCAQSAHNRWLNCSFYLHRVSYIWALLKSLLNLYCFSTIDFRTHNETMYCAPLINSVLQSEIKLCSFFSISKKVNNVKQHLASSCWCGLSQIHVNSWIKYNKKMKMQCTIKSQIYIKLTITFWYFPSVLILTNRAFVVLKF